jgi:hypothetical protein
MSLLKLKSIFGPNNTIPSQETLTELDSLLDDNVSPNTEQYIKNNPSLYPPIETNLNYTEYNSIQRTYTIPNPITISLEKRGGRDNPILDSLLRGTVYEPIRFSQEIIDRKLFVNDINATNHPFLDETFDPRANTPKEGTLYFNTNKTLGTLQYGDGGFRQNTTFNSKITDFSTAVGNNDSPFTPLSQLGLTFYNGESSDKNLSWESLYNPNHTTKENPSWKAAGINAVNYGVNVNRDKLNIKSSGPGGNLFGFSRRAFLGIGTREPYLTSDIPQSNAFTGGRIQNIGSREFATVRGITDILRLTLFLSSPSGIAFIAAQNFLGSNSKSVFVKKDADGKPEYNVTGEVTLQQSRQRFSPNYNPASTLGAQLKIGGAGPNLLNAKNKPPLPTPSNLGIDIFGGGEDKYKGGFGDGSTIDDTFTNLAESQTSTTNNGFFQALGSALGGSGVQSPARKYYGTGDKMTQMPSFAADELDTKTAGKTNFITSGSSDIEVYPLNIDEEQAGIPFYFKDLRDSRYIFFRAYIEGLTENISPSYASHNYIGRSEPVYVYERAEREINFTLKLIAQTKRELDFIYAKMDRLTSMCYPEYAVDDYGNRMKPPLSKLRYGEYFGKTNKELLGYIKSLSYSIDNTTTYETDPITGRVPKHINVTIGFQVIHNQAPSLGMKQKFYGINQK